MDDRTDRRRQNAGSFSPLYLLVAVLQVRGGANGGNGRPWKFRKIFVEVGAKNGRFAHYTYRGNIFFGYRSRAKICNFLSVTDLQYLRGLLHVAL